MKVCSSWLKLLLVISLFSLTACAGQQAAEAPTPTLRPTTTAEATAPAAPVENENTENVENTPKSEVTPKSSTPAGFPGIDGLEIHLMPLIGGEEPLWLAFSLGLRSFDPLRNHVAAIYTHDGSAWRMLDQIELFGPDFLSEASAKQVQIEPDRIWFTVQGGQGANAGCYDLLSFDGQRLESQVSHCNPDAGANRLEDLNGDGIPEVILNNNDRYVFCGACGVIWTQTNLLRWDGTRMISVFLEPLPESAPADLRDLNNRAVELAQAGLWLDARTLIQQARDLDPQEPTVLWNTVHINLNAEAREAQAQLGAYPLLEQIFYGDYEAALKLIRAYTPDQIFNRQTPLIIGTVAEGFEINLGERIINSTGVALRKKPDLAAAYFLRGWARYVVDATGKNDPDGYIKALADIGLAADLDPAESLFSQSLDYLAQVTDPQVLAKAARLTLGETELRPLVEADLPAEAEFEEIMVLPLESDLDARPLWAAFTTGFPGLEMSHFVAIYTYDAQNETSWQELDRVVLSAADPADEFSFAPTMLGEESVVQVSVVPGRLWLEVSSGFGANQGCYDLLSFDGQTLNRDVAQCAGWGRLEDLDGDRTPDVVMDFRDLYIFAGRGLMTKLHFKVWRWDGAQMVEAPLTPLPESAPAQLRDLNNRAVTLAQADLWLEARAVIDQALALQIQNDIVTWNAALIHHRLQVSEQEREQFSSPYPLLSALYDGDYITVIDIMRLYGPADIFNLQTPLIIGTPAQGNEAALVAEIKDHTARAMAVKPDLAEAYFLRGWILYFEDPTNPDALANLEQAALLAPDETLFKESVSYLNSK